MAIDRSEKKALLKVGAKFECLSGEVYRINRIFNEYSGKKKLGKIVEIENTENMITHQQGYDVFWDWFKRCKVYDNSQF